MATGIKIWEIKDQKISPVEETPLAAQHQEDELEAWITQAPDILGDELLQQPNAEIEKELGNLQWDCPAEDGKFGRIALFRHDHLGNRDMWPELFAWLKERAEAFHKVFSPRVKALKLQFALESALESAEETE